MSRSLRQPSTAFVRLGSPERFLAQVLFRHAVQKQRRKYDDPVGIIIMLVIGAIASWLAGVVYKGSGFGLVGNMIVGILGAIIAGYLHFAGIGGQINLVSRRTV